MAIVEIREHVMAFEPDKCRLCGSLVKRVEASDTDASRPFSDVNVRYDCGSKERFSTFTGTADEARDAVGVIGMHVGEYQNRSVYLRRVLTQDGDCFQIENVKLKAEVATLKERVEALEVEDTVSKGRIRGFLRELNFTGDFGATEYPI